jgi:hypothetical protein
LSASPIRLNQVFLINARRRPTLYNSFPLALYP